MPSGTRPLVGFYFLVEWTRRLAKLLETNFILFERVKNAKISNKVLNKMCGYFCNDSLRRGAKSRDMENGQIRYQVQRALNLWQAASRLTFTEVNHDDADIRVSFHSSVSNFLIIYEAA